MELCYKNNEKSLFRKYRHLVTWFANTDLGRDYLKQDNLFIPKEKIALMLPNGYHVWKDKKTIQATFTTRATYQRKMYKALWALDHVSQWLEDFDEAKQTLLGQLDLISWGRMPSAAKMLRFTTTAFNPDAHVETTSVDGTVYRDPADETFTALMEGAGTGVGSDSGAGDNSPFFSVGAGSPNFTYYYLPFVLFDTSSIPDGDEISSATEVFHFRTDHNNSWGTAVKLGIGMCNPASNTSLAASDYQTRTTTRQATDVDIPAANSDATWTLNVTGLAGISKTGITKHAIMLSCDLDRSAPSWTGGYYIQKTSTYADNGSDKPTLTVTYAPAPIGGYIFQSY